MEVKKSCLGAAIALFLIGAVFGAIVNANPTAVHPAQGNRPDPNSFTLHLEDATSQGGSHER